MKTGSKFIKHNGRTPFQNVVAAKRDIETKFDCYECSIAGNMLICRGQIQPTTESKVYTIRLKFDGTASPTVHVLNPELPYDRKAHMFADKSLCLYFPKEQPWSSTMNLSTTIIPWTSEWLVYYELYKHFGVWLGPEAEHGTDEKKRE